METNEMFKIVYGDQCLSRTQVFEWHWRFKEGRNDVGNNQRLGWPIESLNVGNIDKVAEFVI